MHNVRLLIVDPSPTSRERLRHAFAGLSDIEVVAEAATEEKALRLIEETLPTEVLIDCDLPRPGSFAAVREMMRRYPVPIVMLTKRGRASALEMRALEAGAVALVAWDGGESPSRGSQELIRTVRTMSEVKVVRRRGHISIDEPVKRRTDPALPMPVADMRIELVAIGASTGGPPVLQTILSALPRPLPVPIVLVQHISRGFQASLVRWLSDSTGLPVAAGEHGVRVSPGNVYLAPDDRHMTLDASGCLRLTTGPPENGSRPSVSALFRSVAECYGAHAIGILLTGMGGDGAKELRLMRDKGAVTIAQDEETSVVHGMPGEAIKLKGARYVLAPDRIAAVVQHLLLAGRFDNPSKVGCA